MDNVELFNIEEFETRHYDNDGIFDRDPNAQYGYGRNTRIHSYAQSKVFIPNVMKSLMDRGADLEIRNRTGKTPFLLAVVHRQKKIIESFIEYKANVHVKDNAGNNGLHYIALPEINHHFEHVDELPALLKGLFPEVPKEKRFNFNDTYDILKILLNAGVDVNLRNNRGETPLMWAARGQHMEIVKLLLQFGANVHLRNHRMQTCLHVAMSYNYPEDPLGVREWTDVNYAIVLELVRNGACVNCFDERWGAVSALGYAFASVPESRKHFKEELIKVAALVNWRKKMDFYVNEERVLGSYQTQVPDLISYADDCYDEIRRMRGHELPGGSNLCLFARRGVSEDEKSKESEINEVVLEISLQETFPIYHDFISGSFKTSFLRGKLREKGLYTIREERDIIQKISLKFYEISQISSYLENSALFNLIFAFHRNATV